jgi:hypothetical protein
MADNGLASTRPALSAQYEARQNLPFSERVHPALPVEPLAPAYDPDLEGTGGDEQQDRRDVDGEADEQPSKKHLRLLALLSARNRDAQCDPEARSGRG